MGPTGFYMIHFVSSHDQMPLLRDNLSLIRSMVETAMPEVEPDGGLKFRRGSSIVTYDSQRIMIQRQMGPKLAERIQVSFTFRSQNNPFLDQSINQATALNCALWFNELLAAASSSPRVGNPYAELPHELHDLLAVSMLAATTRDPASTFKVHLAFPTPYLQNPSPIGLVEIGEERFQLAPAVLETLATSIPDALFVEISEFNDVSSSITLQSSSLHYTVSSDYPAGLMDQMKAFARYGLTEGDLALMPFDQI
jgi:hypothetical protein